MSVEITKVIELGILYISAAIIPGPSIALIIRNSMVYSRLYGNLSALATITGTAIQSGIVLVGVSFIDENVYLMKILRIFCALYLVFIGIQTILLNKSYETPLTLNKVKLDKIQSFMDALIIELFNPIALSFFLTIITINCNSPENYIKLIYWIEIVFIASIWFFFVAFLASSKHIRTYINNKKRLIHLISGNIFIIFGLYQVISYVLN